MKPITSIDTTLTTRFDGKTIGTLADEGKLTLWTGEHIQHGVDSLPHHVESSAHLADLVDRFKDVDLASWRLLGPCSILLDSFDF